MQVYRISQTRYARVLTASGNYGRWNSEGQMMIYCAGSVALACLENLAHRSGTALTAGDFSLAIISTPADLEIAEITLKELVDIENDWHTVPNYILTQKIGDSWLAKHNTALLKVPSAIIDFEYNYLINPNHADFAQIKPVVIQKFTFDPRLKTG